MKSLELRADGVLLAPYEAKHDQRTVEWLNTPELRDTFGITSEITLASHRRWVEAASDAVIWAILVPQGEHCGNVLLHCNSRHRSAYFQIYLGEHSSRGHGVGRAVTRAV